jgi:hypothetical protein
METSATDRTIAARQARALRVIDVSYRAGRGDLTDPLEIKFIQLRARQLLGKLERAVRVEGGDTAVLAGITRVRNTL